MPRQQHTELLLAKAGTDELALDLCLGLAEAPIELFGFHAQQAAEKLLKAAISAAGGEYPFTHRLAELLSLARAVGAPVPEALDPLRDLTPFAVEYRYDPLPPDLELGVDVTELRQALRDLRAWVEQYVKTRNEEAGLTEDTSLSALAQPADDTSSP